MVSSMYLDSVWRHSISCCMERNLTFYLACIFSTPISLYSFSLSCGLASFLLLVLGLNLPNIGFPPPPHVELVVANRLGVNQGSWRLPPGPSWQPPSMRTWSWRASRRWCHWCWGHPWCLSWSSWKYQISSKWDPIRFNGVLDIVCASANISPMDTLSRLSSRSSSGPQACFSPSWPSWPPSWPRSHHCLLGSAYQDVLIF